MPLRESTPAPIRTSKGPKRYPSQGWGNGAETGTFNGLAQGATVTTSDGTNFIIDYNANYDSNGNFVSLSGGNDVLLEVVPEPNGFFIMGMGLFALLAIGKFRRSLPMNL